MNITDQITAIQNRLKEIDALTLQLSQEKKPLVIALKQYVKLDAQAKAISETHKALEGK